METITAYHFLREDMTSEYAPDEKWRKGQKRTLKGGGIVPCQRGYHGSPTPWDALAYAPGPVLCLVELSGDIAPHGNPVDKYAARTRRLVRYVNVDRELRLFAADCAERVLPLFERDFNDDRPRKAIAAARDFANGEIGAAALAAAADAAWVAAGEAALAAAAGAAAATAALAAVLTAARAAATTAARDAARNAVLAAVLAAVRAAVRDAVRVAEQQWQREEFNRRMGGLLGAS